MTRAVVFCSAVDLLAWYGVFLAVSPSSANHKHEKDRSASQ